MDKSAIVPALVATVVMILAIIGYIWAIVNITPWLVYAPLVLALVGMIFAIFYQVFSDAR